MTASTRSPDGVAQALHQLLWTLGAHNRAAARDHEISVVRMAALRAIRDLAEATPARVAAEINVTRSTVTGVLDALEQGGWVVRVRSGDDRRRVGLALTAAGRTKAEALPGSLPDAVLGAIAAMDPDVREQLSRGLSALVAEIPPAP